MPLFRDSYVLSFVASYKFLDEPQLSNIIIEPRNQFFNFQSQPGDPKWVDDIQKDLHRNFPTHELFGGAYERIGQTELFRVLKAYTVINPVEGYCQAQVKIGSAKVSPLVGQGLRL